MLQTGKIKLRGTVYKLHEISATNRRQIAALKREDNDDISVVAHVVSLTLIEPKMTARELEEGSSAVLERLLQKVNELSALGEEGEERDEKKA